MKFGGLDDAFKKLGDQIGDMGNLQDMFKDISNQALEKCPEDLKKQYAQMMAESESAVKSGDFKAITDLQNKFNKKFKDASSNAANKQKS